MILHKKHTEEFRPKRGFGYIIGIFFILIVFTMVFSYINGYNYIRYETYCFLFTACFCGILILVSFELYRVKSDIFDEVFRNYRNLFWLMLFTIGMISLFWYMPEYACPILAVPIVISLVLNPFFGCLLPFAGVSLYCLMAGSGIYSYSYYLFLIFAGCLLSEAFKEKKNWLFCHIMVICITVVFSCIFYFLENENLSWIQFLKSFIAGAVAAAITFLCVFCVDHFIFERKHNRIQKVLGSNFIVRQQLKTFDASLYRDSVDAAKLCGGIAKLIGANVELSKAAGLYYRVGEMEGMDVESGISIGVEFDLPQELIWILYEVRGKLRKPSTIESGIAFIVYNIMRELKEVDQSLEPIENEIAVHKTMNDLSISGMLDDCGISMNQFLKIKEYLVKVRTLYDN